VDEEEPLPLAELAPPPLSPSDDAAVDGEGGRRRSQRRREAPGHGTAAHASGDGGAGG
jgi:hypothetical protein